MEGVVATCVNGLIAVPPLKDVGCVAGFSKALLDVTADAKGFVVADELLEENASGTEPRAESLPKEDVEAEAKGFEGGTDFCPVGAPNTLGVCSDAKPGLVNRNR